MISNFGAAVFLGIALTGTAMAQSFPSLGPWEDYGNRPSGEEIFPAEIPPSFIGEWNDPVSACGTGHSDMRLRISSTAVSFYESDGEVRRVMRHNPGSITVLATYSGEGQVWDRTDRFVLSRSGNEMTTRSGQESAVRYRCPSEK